MLQRVEFVQGGIDGVPHSKIVGKTIANALFFDNHVLLTFQDGTFAAFRANIEVPDDAELGDIVWDETLAIWELPRDPCVELGVCTREERTQAYEEYLRRRQSEETARATELRRAQWEELNKEFGPK